MAPSSSLMNIVFSLVTFHSWVSIVATAVHARVYSTFLIYLSPSICSNCSVPILQSSLPSLWASSHFISAATLSLLGPFSIWLSTTSIECFNLRFNRVCLSAVYCSFVTVTSILNGSFWWDFETAWFPIVYVKLVVRFIVYVVASVWPGAKGDCSIVLT